MTLATADEQGNPWASPVWFATEDYREFIWVSAPEARHSRNLSARPDVAIVIFDSRQHPGTGEAVYLSGRAAEVPQPELARCLSVFSTASQRHGLAEWNEADVQPPARHRLYHATVGEHFLLSSTDERVPIVMP